MQNNKHCPLDSTIDWEIYSRTYIVLTIRGKTFWKGTNNWAQQYLLDIFGKSQQIIGESFKVQISITSQQYFLVYIFKKSIHEHFGISGKNCFMLTDVCTIVLCKINKKVLKTRNKCTLLKMGRKTVKPTLKIDIWKRHKGKIKICYS